MAETFEPFLDYENYGDYDDYSPGFKSISKGRVGCILLAGGQGTRLGFDGPKGCFPISVVKNKTLFQLFAERVVAASGQANLPLNFAIMTSAQNNHTIQQFFQENSLFGLMPEQLFFFSQGSLPFVDSNKKPILSNSGCHILAPDGNGRCLHHFYESGIADIWKKRGVEYVTVIPVDNPLADPFDANFVGFQQRKRAEVVLKCAKKVSHDEKVGVLVKQGESCRVVEYSEMDESKMREVDGSGALKFGCANLGIYSFSMAFIEKIAENSNPLPIHLAWKAVKSDDEDQALLSKTLFAWKQETYIFDLLSFAAKVSALMYPRSLCFAPLKNRSGVDSPETVKEALQSYDLYVLDKFQTKKKILLPLELSPDFYYPTLDLLRNWEADKKALTGYIESNTK